jgi:predicted HicB family RNase H-like nuclease
MGAQYTTAQRAATEKYMEQHTDRMTLRLPKGVKDEWTQAAQAAGMSLTQYIIAAVESKISERTEYND